MPLALGKPSGNDRVRAQRAHPDLNQGPADLQSAALTTELCTQMSVEVELLKFGVSGGVPGLERVL